MIIGLTGKNCAGKDTFADYLVQKGFVYHSLSDAIRDELAAQGQPPLRENMIRAGNALRARFGPGVFGARIAAKVDVRKDAIIVSVRNPAEVVELRKLPGFKLASIDADPQVRFARTLERHRPGDPQTLEAFMDVDRRESNSPDPGGQRLDDVMAMADFSVRNDGDKHALYAQIDRILEALEG